MAQDHFVKTTGNDGNDGHTWANAKATIEAALNAMSAAGDRVIVAPGVYEESLTAPAYVGTQESERCYLIADTDATIADGGAAYHGVTPGRVVVSKHSTSQNYAHFGAADVWSYWTIRGFYVVHSQSSMTTQNSAMYFGDNTSSGARSNYMVIEDCVAMASAYALIVKGTGNIVRRCFFQGTCPATASTYKTTDYEAGYATEFHNCVFYQTPKATGSYYWHVGADVTGNDKYTKLLVQNCLLMGFGQTQSTTYNLGPYSQTYCQITSKYCIDQAGDVAYVFQPQNNDTGSIMINPTTTGSYSTNHAPKTYGFPYLPVPLPYGMGSLWQTIATWTDGGAAGGGENQYDIFGNAIPGTNANVGPVQRGTTVPRLGGVRGLLTVGDFPIVGNVTEDDTTNGATGTYHEATEAEVQSGVQFGAASALTGTYVGTGGGGRPAFGDRSGGKQ